ncbi:MAG TPA: hypothetical protein VNO22_09780 [Planctomycetota bacterium]|nr:hypothetical protein [Planctomycetota bacterium]
MAFPCPAPYRAALALSIDCDGCTARRLEEVLGYWAGDGRTPWGPALGLPVASSMFVYSRNPAAPPQAAYLDGDRDALREAWRRGWIDSLHGLGDFGPASPCTRELAARAFDALAADGIRLSVWTNHGGPENVQNLLRPGAQGDVPGSPAYLADLAAAYGIRFVWPSVLTPLVGQDREATPAEYYRACPDATSGKRRLARWAHFLGTSAVRRLGVEPYPGNALLRPARLRDGREVLTFLRYGRWRRDTISLLPEILSAETLDRLVASRGAMVVYLHIGPSRDETPERLAAGLRALEDVARRYRAGELWVARTADLLARAAGATQA